MIDECDASSLLLIVVRQELPLTRRLLGWVILLAEINPGFDVSIHKPKQAKLEPKTCVRINTQITSRMGKF